VNVLGCVIVGRGVTAVEVRGLPKVPAPADAKAGDLDLRPRTRASRANAGFGVVFRAGESFKSMVALAASVIEKRHPVPSLVLLLKARKLRVLKPLSMTP
jgi:hypothetical protein